MSSGSGPKKSITGSEWKNQLVFVPDVEVPDTKKIIDDFSLIKTMTELIDASQKIKDIWVYKKPLFDWQVTDNLLNHQFVVLNTTDWWWSIEKDSKQIVFRRGKKWQTVTFYDLKGPRTKEVVFMSNDEGTETMKDLILFLHDENELLDKYHWLTGNCQQFAKKVFDKFAKNIKHDIIGPALQEAKGIVGIVGV